MRVAEMGVQERLVRGRTVGSKSQLEIGRFLWHTYAKAVESPRLRPVPIPVKCQLETILSTHALSKLTILLVSVLRANPPR